MRHPIEPDTVLATVMVARLVGIKDLVDRLGPERWAEEFTCCRDVASAGCLPWRKAVRESVLYPQITQIL